MNELPIKGLPHFEPYCERTTAVNALRFTLPFATVWFSYRTVVAFQAPGGPIIVHRNDWGPTTGRHLNAIDGGSREAKAARLDRAAFAAAFSAAVDRYVDAQEPGTYFMHQASTLPRWAKSAKSEGRG